jgi:transcriptional regulator with XRE-family HTH domain
MKVAILRSLIGIPAHEFAKIIGRSLDTVRSLESGRLRLSEQLAKEISRKTGVSLEWLLDDSITGPPKGPPSLVEQAIAFGKTDRVLPLEKKLRQILRNAREREDFDVCLFRVDQFLKQLEREFPSKASESSQRQL